MLLRPSVSARLHSVHLRRRRSTVAKTADPLRILFCGSDEFSVLSLRALDEARKQKPHLIDSIDVVHRPPKSVGRGLKTLREVPIQRVAAHDLALNTHVIDTFTGWTPPISFNLVITVSFGLFVPPRILSLAKYGGLNVHPSLLPDLRGPAPIYHTLLKKRPAGISVQTLDPHQFDRGTILAQTPPPGITLPESPTLQEATHLLGEKGSQDLIRVLESRAFVAPLKDVGWYADSGGPLGHAEKITKEHRFVDFSKITLDEFQTIRKYLNDPWCLLPNGDRLILVDTKEVARSFEGPSHGIWIPERGQPRVRLACGNVIEIISSTYEGGKFGQGNDRLKTAMRKAAGPPGRHPTS